MAFLSSLSYRSTSIIDSQLKGWFGPSSTNVTDEVEYVDNWKKDAEIKAATFRLFRFPSSTGATGIVSVRGTASALDLLVDNQLWQAAMLAQLVRLALPFGEIFTPILPSESLQCKIQQQCYLGFDFSLLCCAKALVYAINALQGQAVQRVSYYKGVTRFVNNLKDNPDYTGLGITGHSLGGGIAIISAAQTGTSGIAVSGPNAMLSRLSFEPKLTVEQLNSNTFNIVPYRDLVPMFDDKAQNYQNIDCHSDSRNPLSCHSVIRTLCELIYTCGTNNRPALCECVTSFGFPIPETDGEQTFDKVCANPYPIS
jgi:lipase ATG15